MQCIAAVLASVLAVAAGSSVNYCGSRMCANTNAHTFCQFPEGPSPRCTGYINAQLTLEEKSRVLARLNRRRNEAAAGGMRGLASAGNMLKLRWVEELAREAQRWADQCRPPRTPEEHDTCRDLYSLSVGQCVASVVGEAPGLRVESMVDIWYMQSMMYKGNVTFYMPPSQNGSSYADFAQIIWARSYMVGCGRSRFMTPWQGRLRSVERLVCNIAPLGPFAMRPLWAPAAPAATCPPRSIRDSQLTSLCDYQRDTKEIPFFDTSMTLEDQLLLETVLEIENNETLNYIERDTKEIPFFDTSMTLEDQLLLETVLEIENNETLNYIGSLDEIYLTKVAIATMENIITTKMYPNSMQRRDVIEVLDITEAPVNVSSLADVLAEVVPGPNSTLPPDNKTTTIKAIKTTRKKVSLVGRPRSYNMEDLTDFDDKTENSTPIEEIPNKEKDFYAEYVFVDTVGENLTASVDFTNTTEVTSIANVVANQDDLREVVTRLYQNSNMLYGGPENIIKDNYSTNANISSPSDSGLGSENRTQANENVSLSLIDDYLSDPETVRELQEALDRIEHDMAPKPYSEKTVQREPRDVPENWESSTIDKSLAEGDEELEKNKSLDRSPMYNMVYKYMPYLKTYENGLLSNADDSSASRASYVSPSLVLVLTLCL